MAISARQKPDRAEDTLFRQLDAKVRAGMARYAIPGAAVAVLYRGTEYVQGYGVTNVDYPVEVDGDTLFHIGSTTKTVTGTAVMRLVEQGKLDLNAPVRTYLPRFRTADESVATRVTVRQLLKHSAGWLGDYFEDTGRGDDAITKYVAGMERLPQLTPLGRTFQYNNAAIVVAGRLIELVTGRAYEDAVRDLVLEPLALEHSRFFDDQIVGFNVAAPHVVDNEKAAVEPRLWELPRALAPAGGLISSARDQLAYGRFHLGDGTAREGARLLAEQSLVAMRSNPGPGGTVMVELDGIGVTWMLRPSAQGVQIVQHGGSTPGEYSGFIMVPERELALTVLTNSEGGPKLVRDLVVDDWALKRFAGVSNLPAVARELARDELAQYEGRYVGRAIGFTGEFEETFFDLRADRGQLRMSGGLGMSAAGSQELGLAFYRDDYVLVRDPGGKVDGFRGNFERDARGRVAWLRLHGRLYEHIG